MAKASEDEIMLLWQGLGYYARARNMHRAAKLISKDWAIRFMLQNASIENTTNFLIIVFILKY
jgi:adenine-specific DNA glycosylase